MWLIVAAPVFRLRTAELAVAVAAAETPHKLHGNSTPTALGVLLADRPPNLFFAPPAFFGQVAIPMREVVDSQKGGEVLAPQRVDVTGPSSMTPSVKFEPSHDKIRTAQFAAAVAAAVVAAETPHKLRNNSTSTAPAVLAGCPPNLFLAPLAFFGQVATHMRDNGGHKSGEVFAPQCVDVVGPSSMTPSAEVALSHDATRRAVATAPTEVAIGMSRSPVHKTNGQSCEVKVSVAGPCRLGLRPSMSDEAVPADFGSAQAASLFAGRLGTNTSSNDALVQRNGASQMFLVVASRGASLHAFLAFRAAVVGSKLAPSAEAVPSHIATHKAVAVSPRICVDVCGSRHATHAAARPRMSDVDVAGSQTPSAAVAAAVAVAVAAAAAVASAEVAVGMSRSSVHQSNGQRCEVKVSVAGPCRLGLRPSMSDEAVPAVLVPPKQRRSSPVDLAQTLPPTTRWFNELATMRIPEGDDADAAQTRAKTRRGSAQDSARSALVASAANG